MVLPPCMLHCACRALRKRVEKTQYRTQSNYSESVMSHTIELPDPLFREINGYAIGSMLSPVHVIEQAWEEFRSRHPQPVAAAENPKASEALKARIKALRGSIPLPAGISYDQLREEALREKYGPF